MYEMPKLNYRKDSLDSTSPYAIYLQVCSRWIDALYPGYVTC